MKQSALSDFGFVEVELGDVERKLSFLVARKQRLTELDFRGGIDRKVFEEEWERLCLEQRVYTDFLARRKLAFSKSF